MAADAPPRPTTERPVIVPAGGEMSHVEVSIRGRRVRLRRLKQPPTGAWRWLLILGPGLVAAMAGDEAGGIATYSSVGAKFGYELLWVMVLITVSLATVQEMAARLGAATGRGLLDLIRERYGIGWAILAVAVVLIANGGIVVTEFIGIAAAAELFGVNRYLAVPVAATAIWLLVIRGSYGRTEQVFLAMTLVFLAYPAAAIVAQPDWGDVVRGATLPIPRSDPAYLMLLVGLVGTTITPYMQIFQQSSIVEKGVARRHYGPERIDAIAGSVLSNAIAGFIIIATAATLHQAGQTEIESAADAAKALQPVAGDAAGTLFAVGLLGASLLAAGILPLATAYSVTEAFGFRKGIGLDFRRAPIFLGLFTALIVIGSLIALAPDLPVVPLLVQLQVLNAILLPILLVFMLRLANDARLMGALQNGRWANILGWGTWVLVTIAVIALLGTRALDAAGIHIFG